MVDVLFRYDVVNLVLSAGQVADTVSVTIKVRVDASEPEEAAVTAVVTKTVCRPVAVGLGRSLVGRDGMTTVLVTIPGRA